jgi:Flp pilus assembly protein TadD
MSLKKIDLGAVALSLMFSLAACQKDRAPHANGSTMLTLAQYEELNAKVKDAALAETTAAAEAGAKSGVAAGDNFGLAAALYQNHDYVGAVRKFEKVVAADANNSKAWYMLGAAYEQTGDIERAQTAFKKSYDILVAQGYIATANQWR